MELIFFLPGIICKNNNFMNLDKRINKLTNKLPKNGRTKINRVPQENVTGKLAINLMNIDPAWWSPYGIPEVHFFKGCSQLLLLAIEIHHYTSIFSHGNRVKHFLLRAHVRSWKVIGNPKGKTGVVHTLWHPSPVTHCINSRRLLLALKLLCHRTAYSLVSFATMV